MPARRWACVCVSMSVLLIIKTISKAAYSDLRIFHFIFIFFLSSPKMKKKKYLKILVHKKKKKKNCVQKSD